MTQNCSQAWAEISRCSEFDGHWVALDSPRYDPATREPVAGVVVDSDRELAALCGRMRDAGRSSCAILFCGRERGSRPNARRMA